MKYFIAIGHKQEGPFQLEDLKKLKFDEETLVWREGMNEWLTISQLEELKETVKIRDTKNSIIPPPLPIVKSNPSNDQREKDLLLKHKDFKKQLLHSVYNDKKKRLSKNIKSNLYILLLTLPLSIGAYFILAYFEGGINAVDLKEQYAPYLGSQLNRATIDYENYDKVPSNYKKQLKLESEIEDLMNEHLKENELTPSMYQSLSNYHSVINKRGDQGTASFKDGTVALDYATFLDERIDQAFGELAFLKALGIFILLNLLFFPIAIHRKSNLL